MRTYSFVTLILIAAVTSGLVAGEEFTAAPRAAPKPAAFTIITKDTGSAGYLTTVYCTSGSVLLTPVTATQVKVSDSLNASVTLLTINTAVTGVTTSPVTVAAAKFDKTNAIGAVINLSVKVGKAGVVTFKETLINTDQAKTTGSFTTTNGVVTKDAWKTAGANKFGRSWSESIKNGVTTIAYKDSYSGNSFSARIINAVSPKTTLKIGKVTYSGTANYTPATGAISFSGTSKTAGLTATYTFDPGAAGDATSTIIETKNGVAGTPIVKIVSTGVKTPTAPDLRKFQQNMPPGTAVTQTQAPAITNSTLTATGTVGIAINNFTITASNNPASFNATGLPPGLSVNTTTGVISGTPDAGSDANSPYSVTISATNAGGTGTATLVFTINPPGPVINSALTASGTVGIAINTYTITATNNPTSFNATNLPPGLSVDTMTGVISGTPNAGSNGSSPYSVSISATNAGGTDTATLVFTINPAPPVITSSTTDAGQVGSPYNYTITGSNAPTSFNATGLPAGLSVNMNSGLISGTPDPGTDAGSPYSVTISATNAGGTGSATLTLTISPPPPPPPVITSALTATAQVGNSFSYFITATNTPTSYLATGLPSGLTVNFNTGEIFGSPDPGTDTNSPYNVTISATNAGGTGSDTLVLTVNP